MHAVVPVLFVAAACLLWIPFHTQDTIYQTAERSAKPAGQIVHGFELTQTVQPTTERHQLTAANEQHCFSIRFATYARSNRGSLSVTWKQAGQKRQWAVQAANLADNSYRSFCPDAPFSINAPFTVRVTGVDGKPGHSATLWLVGDTRLGTARINHMATDKSMALKISVRRPVSVAGIWRIDHGAFVLGRLCTLAIGLIALIPVLRRKREP